MSDLRVGIIAEGPLDQQMIQHIICILFPERSFDIFFISPTEYEIDAGQKPEGFGWGGVYKVCKEFQDRLEILKTTGRSFDCIVIHVDGDVMMLTYESANIYPKSSDGVLPCHLPDIPIASNCDRLKEVIQSWINGNERNEVYCIPHINTDVWAAYSLYKNLRSEISEGMSQEELDRFLFERNTKEGRLVRMHQNRVKKERRVYNQAIDAMSADVLEEMRNRFFQLDKFCIDVNKIIGRAIRRL